MEDIKERKASVRKEVTEAVGSISNGEMATKNSAIEERLFDFANFAEAKIVLFYIDKENEIATASIMKRCLGMNKAVVLPVFDTEKNKVGMYKVDDIETDLKIGEDNRLEPDITVCKNVPLDCIDIAIIPGLAFDEKGGRIGHGDGLYDKLIPKLPATARKVSIALEEQIILQVPMESRDKYVDIIITDNRVIYKI